MPYDKLGKLGDGSHDEWIKMLEDIDTNKDGLIDFNEFKAALQDFIPKEI